MKKESDNGLGSKGDRVGSLTEYNDGDKLVYKGEALVWKEDSNPGL